MGFSLYITFAFSEIEDLQFSLFKGKQHLSGTRVAVHTHTHTHTHTHILILNNPFLFLKPSVILLALFLVFFIL